MKSSDVYALLKLELAPWFKAAGFKRAKNFLGWFRPHNGAYVVVWCQVSQDGWEPYAGSKFVAEFQRSSEPTVGVHHAHRQRLAAFLSCGEREEIRTIQNGVITALPPPPKSHPTLQISEETTRWYLEQFKPIDEPYPERYDIWLRYSSSSHIIAWASYILRVLPRCVSEVEAWT